MQDNVPRLDSLSWHKLLGINIEAIIVACSRAGISREVSSE